MNKKVYCYIIAVILAIASFACNNPKNEPCDNMGENVVEYNANSGEETEKPEISSSELPTSIPTNAYENVLYEQYTSMGFIIDNDTRIDSIDMPLYELQELYDYFGYFNAFEKSCHEEWSVKYNYYIKEDLFKDFITIEMLNKKYPIEILRCSLLEGIENEKSGKRIYTYHYYTVYKVKEGGYFYVIFGPDTENDSSIIVYSTAYIKELNTLEDFYPVIDMEHYRKATLQDAYDIDSGMFIMPVNPVSYHILNNGDYLCLYWCFDGEQFTGREDIGPLWKAEIVSRGNGSYSFMYVGIYSIFEYDLPEPFVDVEHRIPDEFYY